MNCFCCSIRYGTKHILTSTTFFGYLPQYEEPYWVGYCDIPDGTEFKTAKEMFEAKIYDGQSIKERWENVVLVTLGGINVDEWDEKHLRPDAD